MEHDPEHAERDEVSFEMVPHVKLYAYLLPLTVMCVAAACWYTLQRPIWPVAIMFATGAIVFPALGLFSERSMRKVRRVVVNEEGVHYVLRDGRVPKSDTRDQGKPESG